MVSVIVPVYNGERYLEAALRSVLDQEYRPLELIVVDDGSEDRSAQIATRFPEVRLIAQPNAGPAAARNRGLEAACGELVSFIDADDLWTPGRLAWQLDLLGQRPDLELVGGTIRFFADDGSPPSEPVRSFVFGSCLYRSQVFTRVGPLDESLRLSEDVDWFNRAKEAGVALHLDDRVALEYRRHAGNVTADKLAVQRSLALALKRSLDRRRRG